MKLEPFPQNVFPENFVQWAKPKRPLENWEMARTCVKQWVRKPVILLFSAEDVVQKRGMDLFNDSAQAIPHSHSWGGYLHFKDNSTLNGSSIPPAFCSEKNLAVALRSGCESVESAVRNISEPLRVEITDKGWPIKWNAAPWEHMTQALEQLDTPSSDVVFHQACARIRKTIDSLPSWVPDVRGITTTFIRTAQSAIFRETLPIDVRDGKSVAFPPRTSHFRQFQEICYRPENEIPFGSKIDRFCTSWKPTRSSSLR